MNTTILSGNPIALNHAPLRFRVRRAFYNLLTKLNCPGVVRDFEFHDRATGQHLRIRVGTFLTQISIDGRDYYFKRLSGKFDGTGSCVG